MYSPANSTFFTHESWKSSVPRSAPAAALVVLDEPDLLSSLPHAASSADMPPPESTRAPPR